MALLLSLLSAISAGAFALFLSACIGAALVLFQRGES